MSQVLERLVSPTAMHIGRRPRTARLLLPARKSCKRRLDRMQEKFGGPPIVKIGRTHLPVRDGGPLTRGAGIPRLVSLAQEARHGAHYDACAPRRYDLHWWTAVGTD